MYQETPTLLTVARWGATLGIHPLHLQQVDVASLLTSTVTCGQPVMQYAWQNNARTSREDIALAIQTAEATLTDYLGYAPLPEWVVQDVRLVDQDWRPEVSAWGASALGYPLGIELRNGYLIGGGVRATSLIQAAAPIVYSDEDADGYDETATVTVATSVTDTNMIAVYYQAADTPNGIAADDQWEIRPIAVTIAGGIATIRFRRELAVEAALLLPLEPGAVDGTVDANFLTDVDVYQRYTDPASSVTFQWDHSSWAGGCGSCTACAYNQATGCILSHDDRNGLAYVASGTYTEEDASWAANGWAFCRRPDRAVVSYRAGYRDQRRARPYYDMDPLLERCVAWMAAALLERPLCGCNNVNANLAQWRQDLAQNASNSAGSDSWQLSAADLANPFGTLRGQVQAWRMLTNSRDRILGRRMAG